MFDQARFHSSSLLSTDFNVFTNCNHSQWNRFNNPQRICVQVPFVVCVVAGKTMALQRANSWHTTANTSTCFSSQWTLIRSEGGAFNKGGTSEISSGQIHGAVKWKLGVGGGLASMRGTFLEQGHSLKFFSEVARVTQHPILWNPNPTLKPEPYFETVTLFFKTLNALYKLTLKL